MRPNSFARQRLVPFVFPVSDWGRKRAVQLRAEI